MPMKPLQPCKRPGCREITRIGWCDAHLPPPRQNSPLSAHQCGYIWFRASKVFLAEHPWCEIREKKRCTTTAVLVDHIRPHRGNMGLEVNGTPIPNGTPASWNDGENTVTAEVSNGGEYSVYAVAVTKA